MAAQLPLVLFTTLLVWSAGMLAVQALYALRGICPEVHPPALVFSGVLLVAGALLMTMYLGPQGRLGEATPVFVFAGVQLAVMALFFVLFFGVGEAKSVPVWVAALALVASIALCVSLVLPNLTSGEPHGNPFLWLGVCLGNAFLLGASTVIYLCARFGAQTEGLYVLLGSIVNALAVMVYILFLGVVVGEPPNEAANAPTVVTGDNSVLVWLGAVIIGALLPLLFGWLGNKQHRVATNWRMLGFYTVVAALIGAIYLRVVLCQSGLAAYLF